MDNMERCKEYERAAETLLTWLQAEMNKGSECSDGQALGKVTDMIKDLEQATKYSYESCYYKTVIEAMERGEEPTYGESMGYNHRHMANGQFASAGRGHVVSGYNKPFMDQGPYIDAYLHDPDFKRNMNMGYDDNIQHSRYGTSYDNYKLAKRNYHETKNQKDKELMDQHGMDSVRNLVESAKEIWRDGDPMLKREIKEELTEVVSEM